MRDATAPDDLDPSDREHAEEGEKTAPPGWTRVLQTAGRIMMYAGGISFAVVAILWGGIRLGLIGDFNYLLLAFPTVTVYFAGRFLGYVGRMFAKQPEEDEIVYRKPGEGGWRR